MLAHYPYLLHFLEIYGSIILTQSFKTYQKKEVAAMKNTWAKANAFIQLEDSLLVGGIAGLPVVIALVLFVFIDGFLLKLWWGIF